MAIVGNIWWLRNDGMVDVGRGLYRNMYVINSPKLEPGFDEDFPEGFSQA
jgi:hypothetical protein